MKHTRRNPMVEADGTVPVRPCPMCGKTDTVRVSPAYYGYNAYCDNCYDGAPDAGPQLDGWGIKPESAILDWNDVVQEWLDEDQEDYNPEGLRPEYTF